MKTIVCYGDSNTWGFMPKAEEPKITANNRYPWGVRWTSLLQARLGGNFRVAEAGLNGRTTMFDCMVGEHRNGLASVDLCMMMQMPVDLVVLMLGTNDVKEYFNVTPYMIARGAQRLIERIVNGGYGPGGGKPEILLVAPIRLHPDLARGWLGEEFGRDALKRDAQLAGCLERIAQRCGVHFLDAGAHVTASPADGVHMDEAGHAVLAGEIHAKVLEILK